MSDGHIVDLYSIMYADGGISRITARRSDFRDGTALAACVRLAQERNTTVSYFIPLEHDLKRTPQ